MADDNRGSWTWKVSDRSANRDLNLLYEPGNWGDVLKGAWAVAASRGLVRARGLDTFHYLDPFAGAPAYPLVEAARRRIEGLSSNSFAEVQAPFVARGVLASTGMLVVENVRALEASVDARVFDADAARLAGWREVPGVRILDATSGEEALEAMGSRSVPRSIPPDLILVDPYDLFDRWSRLLPAALEAARRSAVLLYLYNKAPRGGGRERSYRAFRQALSRGLMEGKAAVAAVLGRIPSDAFLPRAWHEVLLMAPADIVQTLRGALEDATHVLSRSLADAGAFEDMRSPLTRSSQSRPPPAPAQPRPSRPPAP